MQNGKRKHFPIFGDYFKENMGIIKTDDEAKEPGIQIGQEKGENMKYQEGLKNLLENVIVIRNSVEGRIARLPEGKIRTYQQTKKGKTYIAYAQIMDNGARIYITKDTQKILDNIPEELKVFLRFDDSTSSVLTQEAVQRKRTEEFMKAEYSPFVLSETQTRHVTSDGTIVRSKSELIIYELLLQYHITFRYEKPVMIDGTEYRPDFTILLPDGKVIYWEHAGMMTKEEYRNRHKKKMDVFESAGIVPWDNLIVTYDDKNGNININCIISEIRNKLLA